MEAGALNSDDYLQWLAQRSFESDVREIMAMLQPHVRERLIGWNQYHVGGADMRLTVSWSEQWARHDAYNAADSAPAEMAVPCMADVLTALLVGSIKDQDRHTVEQEFAAYDRVLAAVRRRLMEMRASYD